MRRLCLGIESTAHTFGIGIIAETGEILAQVARTYAPEQGGLHPQKVVEHHYACCGEVLQSALNQAHIGASQLSVIAFSQGPGLGPCLRVGAAVARTLALKLGLPLVGVNHCVAHIEIGRLLCQVEDPITLYVSGGNTIISAFDEGRYQVFGETLDISIGNLLDMVARDLAIPHPGGPVLEQLARTGTEFRKLPYVVKGMDLSYSGLYSAVKKIIVSEHLIRESPQTVNLIYSLQETAFAMLGEVFERALAHTEKRNVLLTGGVAANRKLQEMIACISTEHGACFNVVPLKLAGDNGVMIAWAGWMQYMAHQPTTIIGSKINPKWRLDEVHIPWRTEIPICIPKLEPIKTDVPQNLVRKRSIETLNSSLNGIDFGHAFRIGAEAELTHVKWMNQNAVGKLRRVKSYRHPAIDTLLRTQRTMAEVRSMLELARSGLPIPIIYSCNPNLGYFFMQLIEGNRLKDQIPVLAPIDLTKIFQLIGSTIAKIHFSGRIHGDLTTSNILLPPDGSIVLIDFGLTQSDVDIEEKAVDLHLFKRVISSTHAMYFKSTYPAFIEGYSTTSEQLGQDPRPIIQRISSIETRGRYIAKGKRQKHSSPRDELLEDELED